MKIALRFSRPVVGEFNLGLGKPLFQSTEISKVIYIDGMEQVDITTELRPVENLIVKSQILEVECVKENAELIREWTTKDDKGQSLFQFAAVSDAEFFEREYAVWFPAPVEPKSFEGQPYSKWTVDTLRAKASGYGIAVEGLVKADLITAIEAHEASLLDSEPTPEA